MEEMTVEWRIHWNNVGIIWSNSPNRNDHVIARSIASIRMKSEPLRLRCSIIAKGFENNSINPCKQCSISL